jgi:hypothetical protein
MRRTPRFTQRVARIARTRIGLLRSEAGVAAVTVLMVIGVLGSLGALVLLAAREDLTFGVLTTSADQALNKAEAGLDSAAEYLFLHGVNYAQTCPATACLKLVNPTTGQPDIEVRFEEADADGTWIEYEVVSSATVRGTRRTLQQVQRASLLGLPYGMFIRGNLNLGGAPKLFNESVLVEGNITGRDKVSFDINDNRVSDDQDFGWIYHKAFIKTRGGPPSPGCTTDEVTCTVPAIKMCGTIVYPHLDPTPRPVACAGAFAAGLISITAASQEEHTSSEISGWKNPELTDCGNDGPNQRDCTQDRDSHQRRNSSTPVVDVPDEFAILKHMEELRRTAEDQGLYFDLEGNGADNKIFQPCDFKATTCNSISPHNHFERDLVFFWDTDSNDTIKIKASVVPEDMKASNPGCPNSDFRQSADTEANEKASQSGLIIIRGGANLELENGACWSGAIFNPEGDFTVRGGVVFVGTVTAVDFNSSGTNDIKLETGWFGRIPAGFREIQRSAWVECERFAGC